MRLWLLICLTFAGCASAPPPSMGPNTGADFDRLKARLVTTGAGLMRANAAACPTTRIIQTPQESFPICAVKVGIEQSPIPNAHVNGKTIVVTTAMIERLDIDGLAFILSHELAHVILGHTIMEGSRPELELEADKAAIAIMQRGGYRPDGAIKALYNLDLTERPAAGGHPAGAQRLRVIRAAISAL